MERDFQFDFNFECKDIPLTPMSSSISQEAHSLQLNGVFLTSSLLYGLVSAHIHIFFFLLFINRIKWISSSSMLETTI